MHPEEEHPDPKCSRRNAAIRRYPINCSHGLGWACLTCYPCTCSRYYRPFPVFDPHGARPLSEVAKNARTVLLYLLGTGMTIATIIGLLVAWQGGG